ncbi:hypothetical protein J6590_075967 [Homalodisca vitripennis]|nr:hypothetical protein J6590_075967 [Homalodisca vitripennis]
MEKNWKKQINKYNGLYVTKKSEYRHIPILGAHSETASKLTSQVLAAQRITTSLFKVAVEQEESPDLQELHKFPPCKGISDSTIWCMGREREREEEDIELPFGNGCPTWRRNP